MNPIWEAASVFKKVALKNMKPAELFSKYRSIVGEIKLHRQRLKNPINLKNGKPLSAGTIANFEKTVEVLRKELAAYKEAIRLLITCGFLTKRFKRTETGLSVHQKFVRSIAESYIRDKKENRRLRRERNETINSKENIERWKKHAERCETMAEHWKFLAMRGEEAELDSPSEVIDSYKNTDSDPTIIIL